MAIRMNCYGFAPIEILHSVTLVLSHIGTIQTTLYERLKTIGHRLPEIQSSDFRKMCVSSVWKMSEQHTNSWLHSCLDDSSATRWMHTLTIWLSKASEKPTIRVVHVFDMLKEHQLKRNAEKCELGQIPWTFGDVPRHRDRPQSNRCSWETEGAEHYTGSSKVQWNGRDT